MSSILKRKRGPVEVLDALKRSKSLKTQNGNPLRRPNDSESGWEAAFNPPTQLRHTNGINGNAGDSHTRLESPDSINFENIANHNLENGPDVAEAGKSIVELEEKSLRSEYNATETRSKGIHSTKKAILKAFEDKENKPWKLSQPIGGRMIDADPVFTSDEKFLIVARRTKIQVYATATSLLTRSIPLNLKIDSHNPPRIITFSLSPTNPSLLWIACSDGTIFSVDWTTGAGSEAYWTISSTGCVHMTVAAMESAGRKRDVIFTTEIRRDGGFRITANELYGPESSFKTDVRTIYTSHAKIHFLQTVKEGSVMIGAAENRLLVGRLRSTEFGTIDKIRYEFRSFEVKDPIKSMDLRVSSRSHSKDTKKSMAEKVPVVDLVVGDIKGVIYVHSDLAGKLFSQKDGSTAQGMNLIPRKLHWHRKAVHTVKWSLDGNYVISGGTETVLVLWQLDTGKQQFLPHMAATIQNVVVSPTGTSYAVQLSDNSAMILSTADLEPKTNIAGIQAPVIETEVPLESLIPRIDDTAWPAPLIQRTPALINPNIPSQLLLAVGQIQEVRSQFPLVMSNPFLQTFDLGTNHSLSSQALTRTNVTNINTAPTAHRLVEPRVVHMKISYNGHWLATVEEWIPPIRDFAFLNHIEKDDSLEQQYRREVHLKLWQWNKENSLWELVSRIDNPHPLSDHASRVLDLVADPSSLRFATIGSDGTVRTWGPKSRKQDGIIAKGKDGVLVNWHCLHAITLGKPEIRDEHNRLSPPPNTGSVSFSEDGSILAAACGGRDGIVHLIDPESGTVRMSQTGLLENEIFGMEFLGPDLIILSERLVVYNLVEDETKLAFKLQRRPHYLSIEQKTEMFHLAVDPLSRTFAVALPNYNYGDPLLSANSEFLVFHQEHSEPQFQEVFSSLITALIPTTSSEGYLIIDSSAEIYTVLQKGSQSITALAQSTSALGLDSLPSPSSPQASALIPIDEIEIENEEYEPITPDATQDGNEDEDDENPVVTQQQLAEVFDIGPAFALPPLEEMFFQVADLFSGKPLPVRNTK